MGEKYVVCTTGRFLLDKRVLIKFLINLSSHKVTIEQFPINLTNG